MTDDPDYRSYLDLKTQMHERAEEETRKRHEEFRHRKQLEDARRQLADDARLRAMMVEVIEEQMARLYVPNFVASLEKLAERSGRRFWWRERHRSARGQNRNAKVRRRRHQTA